MTFRGVASPVDDKIGSILHFAERARDLTTQLGGDFGGAVSQGGVAVDHTSQSLGQSNRFALRFAGDVAQSID